MGMLEALRKPPHWLRIALVAVVLGFGVNSIAHATHTHDATSVAPHGLCAYCATFDALADAPRHTHEAPVSFTRSLVAQPGCGVLLTFSPKSSALPRAPPLS